MPKPNLDDLSENKQVLLTAIETFGADGATREQIEDLVARDFPDNVTRIVGRNLALMVDDEQIVKYAGHYYALHFAPIPAPLVGQKQAPKPQPNGQKIPVSPYMGKRAVKTVSVYTSPVVHENIISIRIYNTQNESMEIPLWGSVRVCIGQEVPMWHPDQVHYSHLREVVLVMQGGKSFSLPVNPRELVTIAPEGV